MPITPTYPGVYVEEIPSGVRTITGVATSITAFVGRAMRGPTDEEGPVTINSYGEYERMFGGLWLESPMSYAVRDFYLNGGSQAVIVRIYSPETGNAAKPPKALLHANGLELVAANPGAWGNLLRARIDHQTRATLPDEAQDSLFNLAVRDGITGEIEVFRNVSITAGHRRQIDKVLANESKLVRLVGNLPVARPTVHSDPLPGEDAWKDNATATNSKVADAEKASDGLVLTRTEFSGTGREASKKGLYGLKKADLFNLLCIPPHQLGISIEQGLIEDAIKLCKDSRAMFIVDSPHTWTEKAHAKSNLAADIAATSNYAALFFPRLRQPNPLHDNQLEDFAPCGAVAGIFARTDAQRGVWKAPAGLEATLNGVPQLSVPLNDAENGELNPLGINCLRTIIPAGRVVWGTRTLEGDDRLASEWKYIPVRRTALFIEESLYRGTQWVVFEPNDEPLWSQIRLNVGAFMHNLFRQGAFQGKSASEAYFVKCDKDTTTQIDINLGKVNILVGFAPLKPAEFVMIKIQQMAGQIQS